MWMAFTVFLALGGPTSGLASFKEEISNEQLTTHLYADNYTFSPSRIIVRQGTNLTLVLHAKDTIHGFKLDQFKVESTMCTDHDFTVTFVASKVGTFLFRCSEPACGPYHPYMVGKLIIEPNTTKELLLLVPPVTLTSLVVVLGARRQFKGIYGKRL